MLRWCWGMVQRVLYRMFTIVSVPVYLCWCWSRGHRFSLRERFGGGASPSAGPTLWVHAASLGEVNTGLPVLKRLAAQDSAYTLMVTTHTESGHAALVRGLPEVMHRFLPIDLTSVWRRFFRRMQPKVLVLIESEFWPNLIEHAHRVGCPVLVMNGRMSERAHARYRWAMPWWTDVLASMTHVAVRCVEDQERFESLGLKASQCSVLGQLKYDLMDRDPQDALGSWLNAHFVCGAPTWVAASTHPGEEAMILAAHQQVCAACPEARLIVVPRHPDRFASVEALIEDSGLSYQRRSACSEHADACVLLGDSTGEMMGYCQAASMVFVGGSLVPIGGHNLAEPASLGKPLLAGPHLFNFPLMHQDFQAAGALLVVQDVSALAGTVIRLFEDASRQQAMANAAWRVVDERAGIGEAYAAWVMKRVLESVHA